MKKSVEDVFNAFLTCLIKIKFRDGIFRKEEKGAKKTSSGL